MAMAGGKIYLNCRWRSFFFAFDSFAKGISLSFAFVILWNVLSSLLEWTSNGKKKKTYSIMMRQQMAKVHKLSPRQGQKGNASDSGQRTG